MSVKTTGSLKANADDCLDLQCGSCWAFSTVGAVEGINAIVTDKLISLSEQELVDCDTAQDHGCHGGLMDFAFEFIKQNGGIDTEKDYKYMADEEKCSLAKEHRHVVSIDGHEDVPGNDEQSLLKVHLAPSCQSAFISCGGHAVSAPSPASSRCCA